MGRARNIAGFALRRVLLHVEDMADLGLVAHAAQPLLDQPLARQHLPDARRRRRDLDALRYVLDHESPSAMRLSSASRPAQIRSIQALTASSGSASIR